MATENYAKSSELLAANNRLNYRIDLLSKKQENITDGIETKILKETLKSEDYLLSKIDSTKSALSKDIKSNLQNIIKYANKIDQISTDSTTLKDNYTLMYADVTAHKEVVAELGLTKDGIKMTNHELSYTIPAVGTSDQEGYVEAQELLKCDRNGLKISGEINASSGKIGNWDITETGISDIAANASLAANAIKQDIIYYLASSLTSVSRTETSGWNTATQTTTKDAKYLWAYHEYIHNDDSKTYSEPVIINVFNDEFATIYDIIPSVSYIRINKSNLYSVSNLTFTINKTTNDLIVTIDDLSTENLNIKVKSDSNAEESISDSYTLSNPTSQVVINLYLGTTLICSKTIPVIKDGIDGVITEYILTCDNETVILDDDTTTGIGTLANTKFVFNDGSKDLAIGTEYTLAITSSNLPSGVTVQLVDDELQYTYSGNASLSAGEYQVTVTATTTSGNNTAHRKQNLIIRNITFGETYLLVISPNIFSFTRNNNNNLISSNNTCTWSVAKITNDGSYTLPNVNVIDSSSNISSGFQLLIPSGVSNSGNNLSTSTYSANGYSIELYKNGVLVDAETISCVVPGEKGSQGIAMYLTSDSTIIDNTKTSSLTTTIPIATKTTPSIIIGDTDDTDNWTFSAGTVNLPAGFKITKDTDGKSFYVAVDNYDNITNPITTGNYYYTIVATKGFNTLNKIFTFAVSDITPDGTIYSLAVTNNIWKYSNDGTYTAINSLVKVNSIVNGTPLDTAYSVAKTVPTSGTGFTVVCNLEIGNYNITQTAYNESGYDLRLYKGDVLVDAKHITCLKDGADSTVPGPTGRGIVNVTKLYKVVTGLASETLTTPTKLSNSDTLDISGWSYVIPWSTIASVISNNETAEDSLKQLYAIYSTIETLYNDGTIYEYSYPQKDEYATQLALRTINFDDSGNYTGTFDASDIGSGTLNSSVVYAGSIDPSLISEGTIGSTSVINAGSYFNIAVDLIKIGSASLTRLSTYINYGSDTGMSIGSCNEAEITKIIIPDAGYILKTNITSSVGGNIGILSANGTGSALPTAITNALEINAVSSGIFLNASKIYANGTYYALSDIRKKNILEDIEISVSDIANSPIFKYTIIDDETNYVKIGTSAQYWQEICPELTSTINDTLTLDYQALTTLSVVSLARIVKEQGEKIAELEAKLNK